MSPTLSPILVACIAFVGCLTGPLAAQCSLEWSSGGPQPQLSGSGNCSALWDPDGVGPASQRLVVGGKDLIGGVQPVNCRVMSWDGSQWEAVGTGPGPLGSVDALTVWNDVLVAGGSFTGGGTDYIALWNGSQWQAIGTGFPVAVTALTVWNGSLVAMGRSFSGGSSFPFIRIWNGVVWTALPTPPSLQFPRAAISYQGLLCVAGSANASPSGALERWNGTSWLPTIPAQGSIGALAVRVPQAVGSAAVLYAGGWFSNIGGAAVPLLAATSGGAAWTWSVAASGLTFACDGLLVRNSGLSGFTVVARVANSSTPVLRWTSSSGSWAPMGHAELTSLTYQGGSYYGASAETGDDACRVYDGTDWVPLRGPGIDGDVHAATPTTGNDMIVGGTFTNASGVPLNRIARWDGSTFQALGVGLTGTSVDALLTLPNGDVVAGGLFQDAGGVALNHVGRWNGTSWSAFGAGMDQQVLTLCVMPNGDVVAGGKFTTAGGVPCARIARWNGSVWSPLGSGMNTDVRALAVRGDGTLFAGGSFTVAGGVACSNIAQWNGTTWLQVGLGCNGGVHALAVRPNGDVVVTGTFTNAGGQPSRCSRWTGSAWVSMIAATSDISIARSLLALPNGDVVAGRGFHQPATSIDSGIARWNGSTWSGIDSGVVPLTAGTRVAVHTLCLRQNGEVIVGGAFSGAGGVGSRGLARLTSPCPALAVPYGTGCSSAAGPLVTSVDALPWIGATFRTKTTGVAANSLCLGLIGLTPLSIPLDSLLPEGQPGCSLLTSLEIQLLTFPVGGVARLQFTLAPDPALIGVTFHQQTVPFEVDGSGAIVAIRGANGITATIGVL